MKSFGLIGRSLGHSFSADYFAGKFRNEGIADCTYSLWELPQIEDLQALLAARPDIVGFNVTIPYKKAILPYLAETTEEARRIGAVNCVLRCGDGRLIGYNTDIEGIRLSFDRLFGDERPRSALILGTGGAAQAVGYALSEAGIAYRSVSRERSRGDLTYADLTGELISRVGLIVNATPVGMAPQVDAAPELPYDALTPGHRLMDLIYNPDRTQFLKEGARRGARILNGLPMLREQAEASWRIWCGATLPAPSSRR